MRFFVLALSSLLLFFGGPVQGWIDQLHQVTKPLHIIDLLRKSWAFLDEYSEIPLPLVNKRERELLDRMNLVNSKIDEIGNRLDIYGAQTAHNIINSLPEQFQYDLKSNDLIDYITRINAVYSRMKYYTITIQNHTLMQSTLQDFAKTTVSHDAGSVYSLMERINAVLVPYDDVKTETQSILIQQTELQDTDLLRCKVLQSPQHAIFSLYNSITLTELKAYTMIQFSYMLMKTYNMGNFSEETIIMEKEYKLRKKKTVNAIRETLNVTSQELKRCDPGEQIAGKTYIQVTNLLQGYIENEADLNAEGTCSETCHEYSYTKVHSCYKDLYCRKQRACTGKVHDCTFIDSDMWICPADPSTGRRYQYVEYENGVTYGKKTEKCTTSARGDNNDVTIKVDSWWRWLFWHCSYCMCLCDEQGAHSDRYINMRSALADVKDNMVVTGLRFVKRKRIIHLQVQQGVLLAGGRIDKDTVHWKAVEDYAITDRDKANGQDYHTLTWEKRAIDLDDIHAKDGYLLTGVRFKMVGQHLNFEIYVTPFDFETGQLTDPHGKSYWVDNLNTKRKQIKIGKVDISSNQPDKSIPISRPNQYIEFTNTDFNKDAAQTTVPFIDSQDVAPIIALPLTGAGIYYKGRPGYGGYIAPKIFNYNLLNLVDDD